MSAGGLGLTRDERVVASNVVHASVDRIHEMVAGRRPFTGATRYELAAAILGDAPPPLPGRAPAGLSAVTAKCLEKDPGRRFACARSLAAALDDLR